MGLTKMIASSRVATEGERERHYSCVAYETTPTEACSICRGPQSSRYSYAFCSELAHIRQLSI